MPKQITVGWILIHPKDLHVLQIHPTSYALYRMRREISEATIFETCAGALDFKKDFAVIQKDILPCKVYVELPD